MLLPSNAPIPQNSLDPPTAQEVARSNAARYQNFMASRTGRERVYSTLPSVESFWDEGPGLAKDAQVMQQQSEMARRSVLNGLAPLRGGDNASAIAATETGMPVAVTVPRVTSLNAPSNSVTLATSPPPSAIVSPPVTFMPAPAPIPSQYGYMNAGYSPQMSVQATGLSGAAPPWSDAFLTTVQSSVTAAESNGTMPFIVLGVLLLAAFGLSHIGEEKKRAA